MRRKAWLSNHQRHHPTTCMTVTEQHVHSSVAHLCSLPPGRIAREVCAPCQPPEGGEHATFPGKNVDAGAHLNTRGSIASD